MEEPREHVAGEEATGPGATTDEALGAQAAAEQTVDAQTPGAEAAAAQALDVPTVAAGGVPGRTSGRWRRMLVRITLVVTLAVTLILVGAAIWGTQKYVEVSHKIAPATPEEREEIVAELAPVPDEPTEPVYFLLLGNDHRKSQTRGRSDAIMVVRMDVDAERVDMLSIPRDTRVPIEGHGLDKIGHANAFGGPALALKTVVDHTGLPINHYVELDFQGFENVVDAVGGVEFEGTYYMGKEARYFVTDRLNFPRGDFDRIDHQQRFLAALMRKAMQPGNIPKLPKMIDAVADNLHTDMSVRQLLSFGRTLSKMPDAATHGFTTPGSSRMIKGIYYLIPDEAGSQLLFEKFREGTAEEIG